jgi:plastocyanin
MRFSTIFAATAALVGAAVAEDHIVVVGNNSIEFFPNTLSAKTGDTVTFRFWPKNHSIVQSTFASPCKPLDGGIWSGFIPSSTGASQDTFQIKIQNDTTPIWYYCSQMKHCQGGMVGVINPP